MAGEGRSAQGSTAMAGFQARPSYAVLVNGNVPVIVPAIMPDKASASSSPRLVLLDPLNLEIADALKAGKTFASPDTVALDISWSPSQLHAIHSQIMSWLKNDDQKKVIELLSHERTAIAHPSVFWRLFHLSAYYGNSMKMT